MKTRYRIFSVLAAVAAALVIQATPARAQAEAAGVAVAGPVVSSVISSIAPKKPPKGSWLKAEVVHADSHSMIVREEANSLAIHTFTYSPDIQDAMQKRENQSGYQYGDKVKILYQQGQTVALRIHGKPSKPLQ